METIEFELLEGEEIPNEFYRDPNIDCIIRRHTNTGLVGTLQRTEAEPDFKLLMNPKSFNYEIRLVTVWTTVMERHGQVYPPHDIDVPYDDILYSLDQINAEFDARHCK